MLDSRKRRRPVYGTSDNEQIKKLDIMDDKYELITKIGNGSFGEVYLVKNLKNKKFYAMKVEFRWLVDGMLKKEAIFYQSVARYTGFPKIYDYGTCDEYCYLVMDLLGPSLEDIFNFCSNKFSEKTVLMIAAQGISRLQAIHNLGYIHRDIKPENMTFGLQNNYSQLYFVDFGLCKRYRDVKTYKHIEMKQKRDLTGTIKYTSINMHYYKELSRRDDLESFGYVLVYFSKGFLPWQDIPNSDKKDKFRQVGAEKINTSIDELCKDCPRSLKAYFKYVRTLAFEEKPDYEYMKLIFLQEMEEKNYEYDYKYDWILKQPEEEEEKVKITCFHNLQNVIDRFLKSFFKNGSDDDETDDDDTEDE